MSFDNPKKILGENIRKRREKLQMSQGELARKLGKSSAAYISLIEGGERNISSVDLMLLAKHLNTSVSALVEESTNEDRPQFIQALRSSQDLDIVDKQKIEEYYMFIQERKEQMELDDQNLQPRYSYAKQKAIEIWKTCANKQIPVMLNDIIQTLGIHIKEKVFTNKLDGLSSVSKDGIFLIMFNKNMPIRRKRFTVAHEIGHIVLEHISLFDDSSQLSGTAQEKEAHTFARELLVPTSDLKEFMKGKKTINDVVERYNVSKEVASIAVSQNKLLDSIKF